MNLIAIDIGNTNIKLGLFLKNEQKAVKTIAGSNEKILAQAVKTEWAKIPILKSSKQKKRDGVVIICSVNPAWTKIVVGVVKKAISEKALIIGQEIPYPLNLSAADKKTIGSDRILAACAAYAVVENAVIVADFGTAVTIDLVDDKGVFLGGVICPGFKISAAALKDYTAQLPEIKITRPKVVYGKTTAEAINCGLYYSAIGTLEEVIRRYAEKIGKWPQTIITGSAAKVIKDDCQFVDSYVPDLVIKGIALAYQKYIESRQ